jgi:hypothetical protein
MAKSKLHQWDVASRSSSDSYKVTEYDDGSWACSCPRWKFGKAPKQDCKHILTTQSVEMGGGTVLSALYGMPVSSNDSRTATAIMQHREEVEVRMKQPIKAPHIITQTRRSIILED